MAGGKNIKSTVKNFPRFEFKAGTGPFKWGGMHLDGDPSSIPVNQPRLIINGRIEDGVIRSRAGMVKLSADEVDSAGDSCITALVDLNPPPMRVYFVCNFCSGGFGNTIFLLDSELDNELQTAGRLFSNSTSATITGKFGQYLYVSSESRLMRFDPNDIPYGISSNAGAINAEIIYDFGVGLQIAFIQEFGGLLFIGVNDPAGNDIIYTWDGVTIASDFSSANPFALGTAVYRDLLVFGYTGSNQITTRTAGGTYTNVAPGAGTIANPQTMFSWRDNLYIGEFGTELWVFDGATLTVARTIANATIYRGIAELRGQLFFAYNSSTGPSARIGKYDGTNWTDVEKNLTTQFTNIPELGGMVSYRERLVVTARFDGTNVYMSDSYDTAGAWVGTNPSVTPVGLAFNPMVV